MDETEPVVSLGGISRAMMLSGMMGGVLPDCNCGGRGLGKNRRVIHGPGCSFLKRESPTPGAENRMREIIRGKLERRP